MLQFFPERPFARFCRNQAFLLSSCLLAAGLTPPVQAADAESAVPAAVTAADFSHLLETPPFRRSLSLSESMVLSGVAVLPDGPMVTLWNRSTRESFVVGNEPNAQGWKLVELTRSTDLRSVTAIISTGGQELTVRFDPERLTPPKLDNTSRPGSRPEGQIVVEALLRSLDPAAARKFEGLPPAAQEAFRKSFAGFLETYPASADGERREFIQRSLTEPGSEDPARSETEAGSGEGNGLSEPSGGNADAESPAPSPDNSGPSLPAPEPNLSPESP